MAVMISAFWVVVGITASAALPVILLAVACSLVGSSLALLWGRWFRDQLLKRRELDS
jgi:membrane protein DedA with SNARE-associated domain